MVKKRFSMDKSGDLYDNGGDMVMVDFGYSYDGVGCKRIIDLLNEFSEENEMLKQFQNNTIKLIDNEIDKLQKKYEFGQKNGMCPMHNLLHTINTLKNLKTELSE